MKRKLILLAIVFTLALAVALPVAISGDSRVSAGTDAAVTLARLVDFHKVSVYDPSCPPNTSGC